MWKETFVEDRPKYSIIFFGYKDLDNIKNGLLADRTT